MKQRPLVKFNQIYNGFNCKMGRIVVKYLCIFEYINARLVL